MDSAARGFHIYKLIWTTVISEELPCEREYYNGHDPYAVAVKKDGVVVGHLPRTHSAMFFGHFYRVVLALVELLELKSYSRS